MLSDRSLNRTKLRNSSDKQVATTLLKMTLMKGSLSRATRPGVTMGTAYQTPPSVSNANRWKIKIETAAAGRSLSCTLPSSQRCADAAEDFVH